MARQARLLGRLVSAGPSWLEPADGDVCGVPSALGVEVQQRFLDACGGVLGAWQGLVGPLEPGASPPDSIEGPSHDLVRWASNQLARLPHDARVRGPYIHALALASWGLRQAPAVDPIGFFSRPETPALWLVLRLQEETRWQVGGRTLYDVAVPLRSAIEDLVWLVRGAHQREGGPWHHPGPWPPAPPAMPWPDRLDGLRAALEPPDGRARRGLLPDTALLLVTLRDYQRYAALEQLCAHRLAVHQVRAVPVARLLEAIGVPARARQAVRRCELPSLWDYAMLGARDDFEERLGVALGIPSVQRETRGERLLRSGLLPVEAPGSAVLFAWGQGHALLELGQSRSTCRLWALGQLWACKSRHVRGRGPSASVACSFPRLSSQGLAGTLSVSWPRGGGAVEVCAQGSSGSHDLAVLRAWGGPDTL